VPIFNEVNKVVTPQDTFNYMAKVFNKDQALKLKEKVVLQYNVLGTGGGTWQIVLENGAYKLTPGDDIQDPQCTMSFDSAESFLGLHTGELGPIKAYTSGKIKFSGSRKIIQQVGKIFPLGKKK
jgi:putative sterol carrier protein